MPSGCTCHLTPPGQYCPRCASLWERSVESRAVAPRPALRLPSPRGPTGVQPVEAEKDFQARVVKLAKQAGFEVYHTFNSKGSAPGYPDLTLCNGKRLVFAELKRAGAKPTMEQTRWLSLLLHVPGVEAYLWRPRDWPQIERVLLGTEEGTR